MKKTLIALAALAVVSAASAQSSVTVYGLLDESLTNQKDTVTLGGANLEGNRNSVRQGIMNGSRIGFKGTEDLGGGLKANFQLEYGIQPDEGSATTTMNNRQSSVGLSGNFGALTIGRQYTPYFVIVGAVDFAGEIDAPGMVAMNHMIGGSRRDNAVQYVSPSISGFQATVQVATGTENVSQLGGTTGNTNKSFGGSLVYAAGPLVAALVIDDVTAPSAALVTYANLAGPTSVPLFGVNSTETKVWAAGALYDFGVAKASFAYTALTDTKIAASDVTSKGYNFSVSVPFGAATLIGNLGNANVQQTGTNDGSITGMQLVGLYSLSKRTTAYAVYGTDKLTFDNTSGEAKRTQASLGLRHTF